MTVQIFSSLFRMHVSDGQVVHGDHRASDWVRLLSDAELRQLRESITPADRATLLVQLHELETDQTIAGLTLTKEHTKRLGMICALESLRRQGKIRGFSASVSRDEMDHLEVAPEFAHMITSLGTMAGGLRFPSGN